MYEYLEQIENARDTYTNSWASPVSFACRSGSKTDPLPVIAHSIRKRAPIHVWSNQPCVRPHSITKRALVHFFVDYLDHFSVQLAQPVQNKLEILCGPTRFKYYFRPQLIKRS